MTWTLFGKVIIITGASTGIGQKIAFRLAKEGCKLVLANRNEQDGTASTDELKALTGKPDDFLYVRCDLSKRDDCSKLMEIAEKTFGGYDALINNAGYSLKASNRWNFFDDTSDDWIDEINLLFTAPLLLARLAIKHFTKTMRAGVIINTSSIGAFGMHPDQIYGSTKTALHHIVQAFAALQNVGINPPTSIVRMNCIAPAFVWTPIWAKGRKPGFKPEDVERDPAYGAIFKKLGGWVDMDILVEEYVKLLTDENMKGKVIVVANNTTIVEAQAPIYGANDKYILPMGDIFN